MMALGETGEENDLFKCFPYMQMASTNVPRLFYQQWRAHMAPGFHTLARHMERRLLPVAAVCLLWRGVTTGLRVRVYVCECVAFFFFFLPLYEHIAWFLGTVQCAHGAWWMCLSWWSRSEWMREQQCVCVWGGIFKKKKKKDNDSVRGYF